MRADLQICITDQLRDTILQMGWGREKDVVTVPNGIDLRRYQSRANQSTARKMLRLPDAARVLGMSARLVHWKGLDDGIQLLRYLSPEWSLAICGDGPERSRLEELARYTAPGRVYFLGLINTPEHFYQAIDAYLFMSWYEPLGLVIGEAMASGVPVFGLAGRGGYLDPRYPLTTPQNSTLIPRRSCPGRDERADEVTLEELAGRLNDYMRSPSGYRAKVEEGVKWIRERFSAELQAGRTTTAYRNILDGDCSRRAAKWSQS
jgi:glycosyltransferase involved in cell wall biosynthesis